MATLVPPSYFLSPLLTPAIAAAAGLAQGEADSPSASPFSGRLCLGLLWYPNIGCPQPALRTLSYKCTGIRTPGVTTGCQRSKQRIPPYVPPGDASGVCSTRPPRRSSAELRSKVESRSFTRVGRPRSLIPHFPGPWDHLENCPACHTLPCQALLPGGSEHHPARRLLSGPLAPHPLQKYVQDILQEQLAETVYRALKEQGGHIYVCGDVTMAADVLKAIQRIMTRQGKLSVEDAGVFISRLRVSDELALRVPSPTPRVLSPRPRPTCLDD